MDTITQIQQQAASQVVAYYDRFKSNYLQTLLANYQKLSTEGLDGMPLVGWHQQLAIGCIALYGVSGGAIRRSVGELVVSWVDTIAVTPPTPDGPTMVFLLAETALTNSTERFLQSLEKALAANTITGRHLADVAAAYMESGVTGIEDRRLHQLFVTWREWQQACRLAYRSATAQEVDDATA